MLGTLEQLYPNPGTLLVFHNPFELLVATILSAQCTDRQVNKTTAKLFSKYATPTDFAALDPETLAEDIKGCGLFRIKSRNIVNAARIIVERYGGNVPERLEDLVSLPGVGRKTANVVLANAFGQQTLAVDTHVFRVSHRLNLAQGRTPEETEAELCLLVPREAWSRTHHWLIRHGREVCHARNPECSRCELGAFCPSREDAGEGK